MRRWLFVFFSILPGLTVAAESIPPEAIPVCYGFGCKTKDTVSISGEEWQQVQNWFAGPAATAEEERTQIQKAAGWLEVIVGRYTPTHLDLGQDRLDDGYHGQMDCIDEANNVTALLNLFERRGLLKFHRVVEQAYRRTAWDQHWAGQIEELSTGKRWVVDSWFQGYGMMPYVPRTTVSAPCVKTKGRYAPKAALTHTT